MFSEMLKEAMKEKSMKAVDLSAATGIGKSSISMYLSGKIAPPDSKKEILASALGLEADYFTKNGLKVLPPTGISRLNLPVPTAAKLMGKRPAFVRMGLQQGRFPWGYAVNTGNRWSYYISPVKFAECTGCSVSGV